MIAFKGVQRFLKRARRGGHFGQLLWRQVVKILVDWVTGVDAVLDPVETSHQHSGERQIRIARRVRATELDAFRLGIGRVHRNAARRRAIALRITEINRRLEAGHQPTIRVDGWRADRKQPRRVL